MMQHTTHTPLSIRDQKDTERKMGSSLDERQLNF
jgi:hypothetical protein